MKVSEGFSPGITTTSIFVNSSFPIRIIFNYLFIYPIMKKKWKSSVKETKNWFVLICKRNLVQNFGLHKNILPKIILSSTFSSMKLLKKSFNLFISNFFDKLAIINELTFENMQFPKQLSNFMKQSLLM